MSGSPTFPAALLQRGSGDRLRVLHRLRSCLPLRVRQRNHAALYKITARIPRLSVGIEELAEARDRLKMLALHVDVEAASTRIGEVLDGLGGRRDAAQRNAMDAL